MATFAFTGAVAETLGYGEKSKFRFGGTWSANDSWNAQLVSTLSGNFTIGKGNVAGKVFESLFKFRNRALLGFEGGFALSAIDDVTGWEEQNIGAAVISFSTQYGSDDTVYAFATIGSKVAIFGEKSTQIWNVDADPTKWSLSQVLDNTGTTHRHGVQSIGEIDVFYPDKTGIRSLRSKELSGDAFVSDIGSPIDSILRPYLANTSGVCSVIDPLTKNYQVCVNGVIYVLSQSPSSKVTAWSTFTPSYEATGTQTGFTPARFFVAPASRMYVIDLNTNLYWYRSAQYDNCLVTVETPWLDFDNPTLTKQFQSIDVVMVGGWDVYAAYNPATNTYVKVKTASVNASPTAANSSTYDVGTFHLSGNGTHIKLKFVSNSDSVQHKLCSCSINYTTSKPK